MVNFPSLLVTEGEEADALGMPGESTVHSWINADFVPSWLRSFTIDQNTRFTRTPDHLLRPPQEQPPEMLPSYGTEGASWHFLEMPLEIREETPPLPSVKSDLAALEEAFADLPALRVTRELKGGGETCGAEGWSVDEHGIETVLSWQDQAAEQAADAGMETDVPQADSQFAADLPFGAGAQPDMAYGPTPPTSRETAPASIWNAAAEAGAPQPDTPSRIEPQDTAPAEAEQMGSADIAPSGNALGLPEDAASADEHEPSAAGSARGEEVLVHPSANDSAAPDTLGADPQTAALNTPDVHRDAQTRLAPATSETIPTEDADASGAPARFEPQERMEDANALEDLAALENLAALEDVAEPVTLHTDMDALSPASIPVIADDAPQGVDARLSGADAPVRNMVDGLGAADIPSGEIVAAMLDHASSDAIPFGDAPDMALAMADEMAGILCAPLDSTLEQLATAALDDTSARLKALEPSLGAPDTHLAPAHLRPLARLIVVGRLSLPEVGEQDLAPRAPAPEAEPPAPSAGSVHASFAWPSYQLNISAGTDAPAPAAEAPSVETIVSAPSSPTSEPEAAHEPVAQTAPVDAAHDPFSYHLPPLDLLREPPQLEPDFELSEEFLDQSSAMLQQILRDFGIRGEVIDANPGPVVTLYEFEPAPGVKSSRVIALAADIARSMSAVSARVAVVEGRNVIGIELPNRRRDTVWLRELLASQEFEEARTKLGLCLGKTIGGAPVIADLARMPHLLVAGTTGSGKSVAINTMILSLIYRHTPDACRLIMIDPKMLELSIYEGIPHLLTPVVTDPKKAIIALKWAVKEMEDRYRKMARLAVRNIDGYNARMAEAREKGEVITRQVQVGFDKESGEALYEEQQMDLSALPYIVIIVDEMADLMMVAGKEIEGAIQRLAQMARAAGIHLVMATQRPSVDVITGTIKANFPTRISFQVTSKIDSRTILGEMGAETLLGQGDMLFMAGGGRITRVHGPFVSDGEVEHVVTFLKAQGGPEYLEDVVQDEEAEGPAGDDAVFDKGELGESGGDLYEQAVAIVLRDRKASTSYIQRRLQVGYNKAASLMERMENEGIVGAANHAGKREILAFSRDRDDER